MDLPPGCIKLFGVVISKPAEHANPEPPLLPFKKRRRFVDDPRNPAAKPNPPRKAVGVPPQRYHEWLHEKGGSEATHVYSRTLYASDVEQGLNRLPQQILALEGPFLAPNEDAFLRTTSLARWNYSPEVDDTTRSWWYSLHHGWREDVTANQLVEGISDGDSSVVFDNFSSTGSPNNGDDQGGDSDTSSSALSCAQ